MNHPFIINKRFAVRLTFVFALLIGATVHQTSLQRWQASLAESQSKANEAKSSETEARERSKQVGSETKIALDRAKEGCQPIVLTQNNKPARFQKDLRVFDAQTFPANPKTPRFDKSGNPINGVEYLPEGLTICNEFGDTAIVGFDGAITDIKRVSRAQLPEFIKSYNQVKKHGSP
ncbi:hypothetical protein ACKFKF_30820 [Phormidesmis sp. 146-12]